MTRPVLVLLLGFAMAPGALQQSKAPAAANARIEGTAVDGADNRPIAGVSVTALQGESTQTVVTGAEGRFSLAVKHGTVRIMGRKDGFAADRDGILISVTPGQQLRGVSLRLARTASISGAISDVRRKPLQYAHALLMRYTYDENGVRALQPA